MKLSQFTFNLPKELLAEHPAKNRDESKLMVIHRKTGKIEHKKFKDILKYFNDMVIKNIDKREEIKKQNKQLLENLVLF